MNVGTFIRSIMLEVGEDFDDLVSRNIFLTWLNDALRELLSESSDWDFAKGNQLIFTTPGQRVYALLPNADQISGVVNQRGEEIKQTTEKHLSRQGLDLLTHQGDPYLYYIVSFNPVEQPNVLEQSVDQDDPEGFIQANLFDLRFVIGFYPIPTTTEQFTVHTEVSLTVDLIDSDNLFYPNVIVQALKSYILAEFWSSAQNERKYDQYRSRYSLLVRNARRKHAFSKDQRYVMETRDIPKQSFFSVPRLPSNYPR